MLLRGSCYCQLCRETRLTFKSVPALNDLLFGKARIAQFREVNPEDVLGRVPDRLNHEILWRELKGKRILVTGAEGVLAQLKTMAVRY